MTAQDEHASDEEPAKSGDEQSNEAEDGTR